MKYVWFVALCVLAFLNFIEAKPSYGANGYNGYGGNSYGGQGNGSGQNGRGRSSAQMLSNGANGNNGYGGNMYGGQGNGSGQNGRGRSSAQMLRPSSDKLDDWSGFIKRSCSESGCISVGNGHGNINIVDIVSE